MKATSPIIGSLPAWNLLRIILIASLSIFAVTIAFHDYPGHDHFSFAHELLTKDAPADEDSVHQQDQIRPDRPDISLLADISSGVWRTPVTVLCLFAGFDHMSSGLAPPTGELRPFALLAFSGLFFLLARTKQYTLSPAPASYMPDVPIFHRPLEKMLIYFAVPTTSFVFRWPLFTTFSPEAHTGCSASPDNNTPFQHGHFSYEGSTP